MSETPTRLEKTDARQGKSGVGLRYVLIFGLLLVVVALILVFVFLR